ncbi:ATPase histone chaperone YTA7 [Linum perenne]
MQLKSPASGSSPVAASPSKLGDFSSATGSRARPKRKRLDLICESVYNQNHNEPNARDGAAPSSSQPSPSANSDLRRSSRVRRPPVVLDVSPPPVKKRNKLGKHVKSSAKTSDLSRAKKKDEEEVVDKNLDGLESPESWKTRLRDRKRNARNGKWGEIGGGKRKLFSDTVLEERSLSKKVESDEVELVVGKTKRSSRVKGMRGLIEELKEDESLSSDDVAAEKDASCDMEDSEKDQMEVTDGDTDDESASESPASERETSGTDEEDDNVDPLSEHVEIHEEDEKCRSDSLKSEKRFDGAGTLDNDEMNDDEEMGLENESNGKNETEHEGETVRGNVDSIERASERSHDEGNDMDEVDKLGGGDDREAAATVEEMSMGAEEHMTETRMKGDSVDIIGSPRVKHGRRCGLCGCGTDGKPPKRLVQDGGESEKEAYCGSSASEESNYDVWDGFGDEPGWLGRLLGPINDRYGIAGIWVHQLCAVWSPEVYFAGLGCLKNVRAALCRGKALKCTRCGRRGATIGCRVDRCPRTYHLPCARTTGCIFDHRKFLIACTDHRHIFQPHGSQFLTRIKKLKARKLKLEIRKSSNDAWRKDIEAEEKWLENCGEDEEFLKRESKRLHRDLARIAPEYIGGEDSDGNKLFEGWESVAGLQNVIESLKEVVILPLLYPEFFSNLGITPPRGVLLHGYPGTGKTLVVRALIGACAQGDKKIAYFARKGADCLGKYVGDAERQLRLLFQVAEKCQPSIIFFDEIDGLAPCRTRQQDQTHSSVVSTLLALMDGLKSRGSVIVIGATNRPEAVDPALRRPGRFDREIYFPLPSVEDRAAILSLHTRRWPKPVSGSLLKWIAHETVGFAGADLQALCTQAVIISLKRNFPLHKVLSAATKKAPNAKRLPLPSFTVEERDWLEALSHAPPPCSRREAGMASYDLVSSALPTHLVPCLLHPLTVLLMSLYLDERLWLPPLLSKAGALIESLITPFAKKRNLPRNQWGSYLGCLIKEADIGEDIYQRLSCAGILVGEVGFAGSDAYTEVSNGNGVEQKSRIPNGFTRPSLFQSESISFASRKRSGFRTLIAGDTQCGQRHIAACILHFFIGNVEILKVDLATVSQEGQSDMVQGIMQILKKCASLQTCMIYMPRIDLWAIETCQQIDESDESSVHPQLSPKGEDFSQNGDQSPHQMGNSYTIVRTTSHAWSSFVEQVESLCVSTNLMILATSDIPYRELPDRVKEFFKSDISKGSSTALEHTVPRFFVNVERCSDYEAVISLSAWELSRNMIQLFVQLTYQRAHTHTSLSKKCKSYNLAENLAAADDTCKQTEPDKNVESTDGLSGSFSTAPAPNSRSLKGKSNALLAIATFGYQILRYPHFAELCWVTSKLKDGPCADVSGPWRIWPFNTCIIRPGNSLDKVTVVATSGSTKAGDKSGFARGLIAVGLLAYRGMYKSVREVCFEVRKVLELLMEQINEKIQAGKDRCVYVRLLSQVAYMEDMVNNWAYGLLSLEGNGQMKSACPSANSDFPNLNTSFDDPAANGECIMDGACGISGEPKLPEDKPQMLSPGDRGGIEITTEANGFDGHNSDARAGITTDKSPQLIVPDTQTDPRMNAGDASADPAVGDSGKEQNTVVPGHLKDIEKCGAPSVVVDAEPMKQPVVSASTEPYTSSENGLCEPGHVSLQSSRGKSNGDILENGSANQIPSDDPNAPHGEHDKSINFSQGQPDPDDSGIVCLYHCCTGCVEILHSSIKKIVDREMESYKNQLTAEDVHDIFASLSVDLLSSVRKLDAQGVDNKSSSCEENQGQESCSRLASSPKSNNCKCRSSGDDISVMPMECSFHSSDADDGRATAKEASGSVKSRAGIGLRFVVRDGILIPAGSEPDNDVALHCKYEALCLCSLVGLVAKLKQPFG